MRVALVLDHVPNPNAGGATVSTWALAEHLRARGNEVVCVTLLGTHQFDPLGASFEERAAQLRGIGVDVVPVQSRAAEVFDDLGGTLLARTRRVLHPSAELVFPTLRDGPAMRRALEDVGADAAFVYHWDALAATFAADVTPKVGVAVDLSHLVALYRWRASLRRPTLGTLRSASRVQAVVRGQPPVMAKLLRDCVHYGNFAAHHAAWLRAHGAPECAYLRTPVIDGGAARDGAPRAGRTRRRILLIGHLRGISTLEGLTAFARDGLPLLEEALGTEGFELRIVGGYEPPAAIRRAFDRPSVVFTGHTTDAADAFDSASLLLVPTPIKLGTRVRILSGFSYGSAVVAHTANALGIPELEHGRNVLLGSSSKELARHALTVLRDDELRDRLGAAGRATYEAAFAPGVAAEKILSLLTAAARDGGRA
jgi:glycosyltransferase involved in cell wall biosynthesis